MSHLNLPASRAALLFVVVVVGALFVWWTRGRPSYLLYQAHRAFNEGNQAAVISEYQKLLLKKDLLPEEEIRLRKALGEFYVRALQESNGISLYYKPAYEVENPFLIDAKKEFERIIHLSPKDGTAHYYLGRILWLQHLESFAIEELNLSRSYDSKNPEPLWFLARVQLERGEASAARELALQALAIRPDHDEARLVLVESYAALGEHEEALKEFDRLSYSFKDNPDTKAQHALYLAQENEWPRAMALIEDCAKTAPVNGRVKLIHGRLLLDRGLTEEAAGQFAQGAALMPKNVWPFVWQVKTASLRGRCEEAGRLSQLLVEAFPRWGWAHLARAWDQLCRRQASSALLELDEADRLSKDLMEAKELKADLFLKMERFEDLGKIIRVFLDQKKNQSKAYSFLTQSFYLQENFSMAAEMAESAIKRSRQNADGFIWLGMARAGLKDVEGASRAFDNAKSLRPFDPLIRGYEIYASVISGSNSPEASNELRGLIKTNVRNARLWFLLGEVCRLTGRLHESVEAYLSAIEEEPWFLRAQLGLLKSYTAMNQPVQAASAWRASFQINPKNKEVLAWRAKIRKDR